MASKFSKFLFFTAATAAATAAVYYLVKKNEEGQKATTSPDDDDDFVYDEDLDAEKGRTYVSLNLDNVESALTKAKEVITDSYQHVKETVKAGLESASGGVRDFVDLTREGSDEDVVDAVPPATSAKEEKADKKADDKAGAPEKKADVKADKDESSDMGFKKPEYKTAKVEPAPAETPKEEAPAKKDEAPAKKEEAPAKKSETPKPPAPDDYSDLEEAGTPLIVDDEPEPEKAEGFFDEETEEDPEDEWASLDREYASFKK